MKKKITILLIIISVIGFTISNVNAGTGYFKMEGIVGNTYVIEKLPDNFGNQKYGSFNMDRVHAFEKSGLFTEKPSINKHKEKIYGKYEFTAKKAGSVTVKIDYWDWINPDYYTFNIVNNKVI
jgi:hypothetical protein